MKRIYLLPLVALALVGCAPHANLTTTQGQTAATVDNASTIAQGAVVASSNTATGTTVSTISGTALTLNPAATATGTVPATFTSSLSVQFSTDIKSYTQTAGNMMQTILPQVVALAGDTQAIDNLITSTAKAWGLTPANATQASVLTNIGTDSGKVAAGATALLNLFTGIQTTGTI